MVEFTLWRSFPYGGVYYGGVCYVDFALWWKLSMVEKPYGENRYGGVSYSGNVLASIQI